MNSQRTFVLVRAVMAFCENRKHALTKITVLLADASASKVTCTGCDSIPITIDPAMEARYSVLRVIYEVHATSTAFQARRSGFDR